MAIDTTFGPDGLENLFLDAIPPFNYTASSLAGTGAADVTISPLIPNEIVPLKSFSFCLPGGTQEFDYNRPAVLSREVFLALVALNGGTKASGTATVGGTWLVGDTATIVLAGVSKTYTLVTGDTVLATLASHLATFITANFPFVVGSYTSGNVTNLTAAKQGVAGDYTFTVSHVSTAGTIVRSAATLTGGVNGKLFS